MDNLNLAYKHFQNLNFTRQWDFILKNKNCFIGQPFPPFSELKLSLTIKSAENELEIIKAFDFFLRFLPSSNLKAMPLFRFKKYNTTSPLKILFRFRGFKLYKIFLELASFYRLALVRHTYLSTNYSLNSVSFNLGNLNELAPSLNPLYDYSNWKAVLSFFFFIQSKKITFNHYFFSIFGIFFTNNIIIFSDEAFNF